MDIRRPLPHELPTILKLLDVAFEGPVESTLVAQLYAAGDVLADYVAVEAEEIIGYLLLCPIAWTDSSATVAGIAPVAVLPAWQRRGIGSALVQRALDDAPGLQIGAILILGDPAYYTRFGFSVAAAAAVQCKWSGPYLMARTLGPASNFHLEGVATYPAAFDAL